LLKKNKIFAIGRRKTARAQIQLITGTGLFIINGKPAGVYMQENLSALLAIQAPLQLLRVDNDSESKRTINSDLEKPIEQKNSETTKYDTVVKVNGGGLKGQAEAIQLAIAKALCLIDESYRSCLRTKGYLTRDSRSKERKKYGLKKARKAPQFSKR
jgi:small subunit ribosomal protein S9